MGSQWRIFNWYKKIIRQQFFFYTKIRFKGSDIVKNKQTFRALPTRDAALPIIACLCSAVEQQCSLIELFASNVC